MAFNMKGMEFGEGTGSALKSKNKNFLDNIQTGLSAAGLFPAAGNVADFANTAISGARALGSKIKGDKEGVKRHLKNTAINAGAMVPVVGQGIGAMGLARDVVDTPDKQNKLLVGGDMEESNIT